MTTHKENSGLARHVQFASDLLLATAIGGALLCTFLSFFVWRPPEVGEMVVFAPSGHLVGQQDTRLTVARSVDGKPGEQCTVSTKELAEDGASLFVDGLDLDREDGPYRVALTRGTLHASDHSCPSGSELFMGFSDLRELWYAQAMEVGVVNLIEMVRTTS